MSLVRLSHRRARSVTAVWDSGLRGEPATAEMRINARLAAVTAVQKCTEIVRAPTMLQVRAQCADPGCCSAFCATPAACKTT